jgi:CheY-like chemotaxis protein
MSPELLSVLCVDDQESIRSIVRSILRRWGIRDVQEAEDGLAALRYLSKKRVDVIITDWNMPNVNGMQLFKTVMKNPQLKSIPVIMLTGHVKEKEVRYAVSNGVRFFLAKPVQPPKLRSRIEAALGPLDPPSL